MFYCLRKCTVAQGKGWLCQATLHLVRLSLEVEMRNRSVYHSHYLRCTPGCQALPSRSR